MLHHDSTDRQNAVRIQAAKDINEILKVVATLQEIKSTRVKYHPEEMRVIIERVRNGHAEVHEIPTHLGLRNAVRHHLPNDPTYKKRVLKRKK